MFKHLTTFIFFFSFGFGYALNPLKPKIHIYLDYATTPALLQMTDFIKQPQRDKKFIFWRRFPNLTERVNLADYNAVQIDLPQSEGKNKICYNIVENSIQTIYEQNPDTDYIIHSNLWWNELLIPILRIIPKEHIKHLHIYEDGVSNIVHSRKHLTITIQPDYDYASDLQHILNNQKEYSHHYDLTFHTLYPTTYYFGFVDYAKNNEDFYLFMNFISTATIQEINYEKIAKKISEKQKKQIFALVGFEIDDYKKQIENKPVDFFLLRGAFSSIDEQIKTVPTLFKNDKNRVLVLKEHPNLNNRIIAKKIQEKLSNAVIFPKHIPFEVLILADLMPDTVSGYTTSVF
ncbi:MAG: hypothetical protein IJV75_01985, partial [Alphaproteobacteria bacterium]|nr:hypothetical protein [Alphaproteobacteria bacterium]